MSENQVLIAVPTLSSTSRSYLWPELQPPRQLCMLVRHHSLPCRNQEPPKSLKYKLDKQVNVKQLKARRNLMIINDFWNACTELYILYPQWVERNIGSMHKWLFFFSMVSALPAGSGHPALDAGAIHSIDVFFHGAFLHSGV